MGRKFDDLNYFVFGKFFKPGPTLCKRPTRRQVRNAKARELFHMFFYTANIYKQSALEVDTVKPIYDHVFQEADLHRVQMKTQGIILMKVLSVQDFEAQQLVRVSFQFTQTPPALALLLTGPGIKITTSYVHNCTDAVTASEYVNCRSHTSAVQAARFSVMYFLIRHLINTTLIRHSTQIEYLLKVHRRYVLWKLSGNH